MLTGYSSGLQRQYVIWFFTSHIVARITGCEMLERSAVKVARSVLRGFEVGNDLRLLDWLTVGVSLYEWRQNMNVRYSTTPKSERLTDAQFVNAANQNYKGSNQNKNCCPKGLWKAWAGCDKSRKSGFRRGRASNRSFLFGTKNTPQRIPSCMKIILFPVQKYIRWCISIWIA